MSGQKLVKNAKKWSILASFWKPEACGQTVLPDRSDLIGQKLVENYRYQEFKYGFAKIYFVDKIGGLEQCDGGRGQMKLAKLC